MKTLRWVIEGVICLHVATWSFALFCNTPCPICGGMQDDLLYETLTVYETLYYAAMLRLPASMATAQKCERVENVILSLGLDKCRDTIVGAQHPLSPV